MVLKSYRFTNLKKKKKPKKKRRNGTRDLVTGAVGALIGVAFVSQTAGILKAL